jgi:hypothetical protein
VASIILAAMLYNWSQSNDDDFSDRVNLVAVFGGFLLIVCFVLNLRVFAQTRRVQSLVGIGIVLVTCALCTIAAKSIDNRRRQWFLTRGVHIFQDGADLISDRRDTLSEHLTNVAAIVPRPMGIREIVARTNSDGSIFLMFIGRGRDPSAGYVFYDGPKIAAVPGRTNLFNLGISRKPFRELTNSWYEY